MIFHIALFEFVVVYIQSILAQDLIPWIVPMNITLPRLDSGMATVIINDTIYLLGGKDFPRQSIEFDPISNTFTDNGARCNTILIRHQNQPRSTIYSNQSLFILDLYWVFLLWSPSIMDL
eukprot:71857_1